MKRFMGLTLALMIGFSTSVLADVSKIGVVDLQKIIQTSSQMKDIQQKLETEFKPRRDKLIAMEQSLKKDMDSFKRDMTVLGPNQKKEMEKKINTAKQNIEREGNQYQQGLSTKHNEAMEVLYGKIRKAISKIAEEQKYDLVFQKDAAPFSIENLDITAQVTKQLDEK